MQREEMIETLRSELRRIQPRLPEAWASALLFQTDLGLDSLDLMELVARCEQKFGLLIENDDLPKLVSLDAIADYLVARDMHGRAP